MQPPRPNMVDLTAQPMPSGQLRSDELLLERYTKETEKLSRQAQPTAEMARSLEMAAQSARTLAQEMGRLPDAVRMLGTVLRETLTSAVENAARSGRIQPGIATTTSAITPAVTGIAASIALSRIATQPVPQLMLDRIISRTATESAGPLGRLVESRGQRLSRQNVTQGGQRSVLDILRTGTAEEIAGLGVSQLGQDPQGKRIQALIANQQRAQFRTLEEALGSLSGLGGRNLETALTSAQDIQSRMQTGKPSTERRPVTPGERAEFDVRKQTQGVEKDLARLQARMAFEQTKEGRGFVNTRMEAQPQLEATQRQYNLQEELRLLSAREKFLASPAGKDALRRESDIRKEINRIQQSADWRKQVEQLNIFGASIGVADEWLKKLQINLQGIGRIGGYTFLTLTSGILSFVSAADPVAYQTFRRSVEGLAVSLGSMFGDSVLQAAGGLQQLADSIDALDPATKQFIVRTTLITTGVGALLMILPKLAGGLRLVGSALAFVFSSPTVFIITAATAALGTMAYQTGILGDVFKVAGDQFERLTGADLGKLRGVFNAAVGNRGNEPLNLPPVLQSRLNAAGGDPTRMREELRKIAEEQARTVKEAQDRLLTAGGGTAEEQTRLREEARARTGRALVIEQQLLGEFYGRQRYRPLIEPTEAMRSQFQQQAAYRAITGGLAITGRGAEVPALVEMVLRRMQGRPEPAGGVESPAVINARQRLQEAKALQDRILGVQRETGGLDPRLSLKGLLPSPQMFTNFAQFGEQLQMHALERWGVQDAMLSIREIQSILSRIQGGVETYITSAQPQQGGAFDAFMRMFWNPSRGGTGR
jgi:hypothetical protein